MAGPEAERLGTVLLLHGGGQTRHSWHGTAEALAEVGWDTLAVDARGHGDSDWATDGDYGIDAYAGDLVRIIDQLDDRPVVVGASLGGMTALIAQDERPALMRALVLVDFVPRLASAGVARIVEFMTGHPDGFGSLEEAARAVRAYNPHRRRPATADGLRKNLRKQADGRWYWHWDPAMLASSPEDRQAQQALRITAAASRVRVPTLLIRGKQSDIVSEDAAAELVRLVPGAKYVDVAGTGHMVAGNDNLDFTDRVKEFLIALNSAVQIE
jgi:pimeloyl-ACP methyl ester carboxylesterase